MGTGQSFDRGGRRKKETGGSLARRAVRQRRGNAIRVNMAPMIDMTFLLFSFVIVTSTFERPEGVLASQLPGEAGGASVALPFSPIVIRVKQTGDGDSDFKISVDGVGQKIQSVEQLPPILQQLRDRPGFDKTTPVVIVADDEVRWDHVVSCWNAALRAGCENIAFAQP